MYSGYQGFGGAIASRGGAERGGCRKHEHCRVDGTSCPWCTPPTPRKHRRGQGHAPRVAGRARELMCYQGAIRWSLSALLSLRNKAFFDYLAKNFMRCLKS